MGSLIGHVAPGYGILLIGLWHLVNQVKLHLHHPNSSLTRTWFPASKYKYLELWYIMLGSILFIVMELFVFPKKHHPFDDDGTIPSYHLHNVEHASIAMTFFFYAAFALLLDKFGYKAKDGLTQFLGATALAQELLLFRLHSTDHSGPEGQYHLLLQLVLLVSLITIVAGMGLPKSFLVSFVRSLTIFFQGLWLMVTGFMLYTPALIPKGCFINREDGHNVVRCQTEMANHRAKSLANLLFSFFLIGVAVFGVSFYMVLVNQNKKLEYSTVLASDRDEEADVYVGEMEIGDSKSKGKTTFVPKMEK